ncbi:hypothetical protein MAMC_00794 [Methylacidimicrobium cyclopophantes]|uniref:Uncharacterized protein n=1 Tax=Methylacidimicrobium cyclopophantes TaxID=1041766 RepID=A0A5E6MIB4_9BACT|nr:hypothetical protein MAMC_00794 [Methylacidimicrobium cyclopophantes]
MHRFGPVGSAFLCLILFVTASSTVRADPVFYPGVEVAAQDLVETMNQQSPGKDWLSRWRRMTIETREKQTHWLTPIVTETPRLEQRIRYDVYDETLPNGNKKFNFGAGKGINFIVAPTMEAAFSLPQYLYYPGAGRLDGFRGESFMIKNRIMASPEDQKNYVFSVMLEALSPTGTLPDFAEHWIWTPMLTFGKGWGHFDFMVNLGTAWADADNRQLGSPIVWGVALQYRFGVICPTIEVNSHPTLSNFFFVGQPGLFVTPEVLIGRFHFRDHWSLYFGFGYQMALDQTTLEEQYANAFIAKFHLLF